jgi:hypothetical protein
VLSLCLGWHWAFLQGIAWTGMVIRYAAESNLADAVQKTFDGQHPCPMCKAIQKGKAEDKSRDQKQQTPKVKFELVMATQAFVLPGSPDFPRVISRTASAPFRCAGPPKPPPRVAHLV